MNNLVKILKIITETGVVVLKATCKAERIFAKVQQIKFLEPGRCDNCASQVDVVTWYRTDQYGIWSCKRQCRTCRFMFRNEGKHRNE